MGKASELEPMPPYPGEILALIGIFMADGRSYNDAYARAVRMVAKYGGARMDSREARAEFWTDLESMLSF